MNIKNILNNPIALLKSENIFLLSHMRGNTSLLSHLLGNHSEIEGYYEMHIGYYSWKSLYRQKLLYLKEHQLKAESHYFFDKILHNEHHLRESILKKSKVIIMLREPEQTILSIINLYQKIDPAHPFCQEKPATQYYIERLQGIWQQAQLIPNQFYYLQAEKLRSQTKNELLNIQQYLKLQSPIAAEYELMKNTGKEKYGDSSQNINTGKVQKQATDYSDIALDTDLIEQALKIYQLTADYCQMNTYRE